MEEHAVTFLSPGDSSLPPRAPLPHGGNSGEVRLSTEEVALLQASVAFHARYLTDPALRERLERLAAKLFAATAPAQAA